MTGYVIIDREEERSARRRFVTPEGVDLGLRLADQGQRITAFLLDLTMMIATLVGFSLLLLLGASSLGEATFKVAGIVWLLGFFLLRNGYFILLEMGPRAATFGKRAVGLRVVASDGGRLTADSVIARNLLREIEFYLPLSFLALRSAQGSGDGAIAVAGLAWAAIFLFFPFFNRDRLRVGDLLAGTWVISVPKRALGHELGGDALAATPYAFTGEQLGAYGTLELQTLEKVLRARDADAMGTVAYMIREKIGIAQHGGDEEFLTAYYDALRSHLERNLLFGRRRDDKNCLT